MAGTLKGKGIIAHINGITFTAGIVSATTLGLNQSGDFERTSDKYEVLDGNGDVVTQYYHNHKKRFRVTVIPYAVDIAGARTSLDAWLVAAGLLVTVADADSTVIDDNYNVQSARHSRSNVAPGAVDLDLEAADANEIATAPIT